MSGVFTQHEIVKGESHRVAFMDDTILNEWLGAGWSILHHYPNVRLVRNKDGRLVEEHLTHG